MKTLVGVNTLAQVSSFVYSSHIQFWNQTKRDFPKDDFLLYTPYRMSIDAMRNDSARIALEQNCDYLMFIDDDVVIKPNTFKVLRDRDKDIIMAMTFVRGHPFHPMFFKDFETIDQANGKIRKNLKFHDEWKDDLITEGPDAGLVKTGAVGFSCVLIKVDVIRAMTPPYFVTGPGHTEDVYFCLRVRAELEPEPTIFVDTTISTGHMLMEDLVSLDNVEKLREFYAPEDDGDILKYRMKEHLKNVIQKLSPLEVV
jgi:hypothetical protein